MLLLVLACRLRCKRCQYCSGALANTNARFEQIATDEMVCNSHGQPDAPSGIE
jgi:hypothetical protein